MTTRVSGTDTDIFSVFIESPNNIVMGTDRKKMYRYNTTTREKMVLFDSRRP